MGITVHFINAEWKLRRFVLAVDMFSKRHTGYNIAKINDDVIEKVLTNFKSKTKVVSDNASFMVKAFQVSLSQFVLHKSDDEVDGYDKELLFPNSVSKHDFVEGDTDLNFLLSCLPERVSCFAKQLTKVADIVNFN